MDYDELNKLETNDLLNVVDRASHVEIRALAERLSDCQLANKDLTNVLLDTDSDLADLADMF